VFTIAGDKAKRTGANACAPGCIDERHNEGGEHGSRQKSKGSERKHWELEEEVIAII
jgi:hypothetical protein